ncbi:hypothetical protein F4818DRAFT_195209 [Hypoxylon cercidicola]|nr:hypothetical protein F4818DRAFT_195209 [Hypoxylon cercidicola]
MMGAKLHEGGSRDYIAIKSSQEKQPPVSKGQGDILCEPLLAMLIRRKGVVCRSNRHRRIGNVARSLFDCPLIVQKSLTQVACMGSAIFIILYFFYVHGGRYLASFNARHAVPDRRENLHCTALRTPSLIFGYCGRHRGIAVLSRVKKAESHPRVDDDPVR